MVDKDIQLKEINGLVNSLLNNLNLEIEDEYLNNNEILKSETFYIEIFREIFTNLSDFPDQQLDIRPDMKSGAIIQMLIEKQSSDILQIDLAHISGDAIAEGDLCHIQNFLQLQHALTNNEDNTQKDMTSDNNNNLSNNMNLSNSNNKVAQSDHEYKDEGANSEVYRGSKARGNNSGMDSMAQEKNNHIEDKNKATNSNIESYHEMNTDNYIDGTNSRGHDDLVKMNTDELNENEVLPKDPVNYENVDFNVDKEYVNYNNNNLPEKKNNNKGPRKNNKASKPPRQEYYTSAGVKGQKEKKKKRKNSNYGSDIEFIDFANVNQQQATAKFYNPSNNNDMQMRGNENLNHVSPHTLTFGHPSVYHTDQYGKSYTGTTSTNQPGSQHTNTVNPKDYQTYSQNNPERNSNNINSTSSLRNKPNSQKRALSPSSILKKAIINNINRNIFKHQGYRCVKKADPLPNSEPLAFTNLCDNEKMIVFRLYEGNHIKELIRFLKDKRENPEKYVIFFIKLQGYKMAKGSAVKNRKRETKLYRLFFRNTSERQAKELC